MKVYIVFNINNNSVYSVYQDKDDAEYWKNNLNEIEDKFIIIESFMRIIDSSKLHYSEEDNNIDEEDYDVLKDENKNLKNKIQDYEKVIKVIKGEYIELSRKCINELFYSNVVLILICILCMFILK